MKIFKKSNSVSNFVISIFLIFIMLVTSVPQIQAASYSKTTYAVARFYITDKENVTINSWTLAFSLSKYYTKLGNGSVNYPSNISGSAVNSHITTAPSTDGYLDDNQYIEWNRMIKSGSRWYVLGNIITVEKEPEQPIETAKPEETIEAASEAPVPTETTVSEEPTSTEDSSEQTVPGSTAKATVSPATATASATSGQGSSSTTSPATAVNGFVHTSGTKYYDENGKEFVIKGMNFGNYMWYNPTTPQKWYNNENSYKELADAGFNTIRYYLNYALLEDDNNPYVYKETGLAWLDQNVAWAEKYGIKILFNMHIPQGSKDVDSWDIPNGSLYLFAGSNASENRNRLKAMWKFLANRYKDSKAVLGYGLLNEPKVAYTGSIESSKATWEKYAQELTDVIRTVDKNHILFVEPTTSIIDVSNNMDMVFEYSDSLFLINDSNFAVEYHFYYPIEFTHQATNTSYAIGSSYYPNYDQVTVSNPSWYTNIYYSSNYDYETAGWQYVESPTYTASDLSLANAAYATLRAKYLGAGSYAYFDNIVVSAYDENGNYVGEIKNYNCNTCDDYKIIDSFYGGNAYYSANEGIDGSGCIVLKDADGEFTVSNSNTFKYFALKKGYSYKISAYVKVTGSTTSLKITPTISFVKADSVNAFDKSYLKDKVSLYTKFMYANNIPLYMGEYGTFVATFAYGGNQWVSDMLDIFREQDLSASFHEYKPGLYSQYDSGSDWCVRNDSLYSLFKAKYTAW